MDWQPDPEPQDPKEWVPDKPVAQAAAQGDWRPDAPAPRPKPIVPRPIAAATKAAPNPAIVKLFGKQYPKAPEWDYMTDGVNQDEQPSQLRDIAMAPVSALQTIIHGTASQVGRGVQAVGNLEKRVLATKTGAALAPIFALGVPNSVMARGAQDLEGMGQDIQHGNQQAVAAENYGLQRSYGIHPESDYGQAAQAVGQPAGEIAKFALAPVAATGGMIANAGAEGYMNATEHGASLPASIARGVGGAGEAGIIAALPGGKGAYSSVLSAVGSKVIRGAALGSAMAYGDQLMDKLFIDNNIPLTPDTERLKKSALQIIAMEIGGDLARGKSGGILGPKAEWQPDTTSGKLQQLLAPAATTPVAEDTALNMRQHLAEADLANQQARAKLKPFSKHFSPEEMDKFLEFTKAFEQGGKQPTPELQDAADAISQEFARARGRVRELPGDKLQDYIENYFPHLWADKQAVRAYLGKRPISGSGSFLKERSIPTIQEGVEAGLTPLTSDPTEAAMLQLASMNRFISGQKIAQEMKDKGIAKFVSFGDKAPDGYAPLDDKAFNVMQHSETEGGMIQRGRYYAPAEAATVFNNHVSSGLRGNPIYDTLMGANNTLNQIQLGLSAYHLGFTSMDSGTSQAALGLRKMLGSRESLGERVKGAGMVASFPAAPVTNIIRGNRYMELLKNAEPTSAEAGEAAKKLGFKPEDALALQEAFVQGGGRIGMDPRYTNQAVEKLKTALSQRDIWGAAKQAVPAATETMAKPIMEVVVPRMKLGVYLDLVKHEMARLPENASETQKRQVYSKAWDSVDNRMGQMVYDNLFWDKTLKDVALASTRSLGWNLGTVRELGGGVKDLAEMTKGGPLTNRGAYAMALPAVTAITGAIFHYLSTGKRPEGITDAFYPQTGATNPDGSPERVELPTYMKDVVSYSRHPGQTILNKMGPVPSAASQLFQNKDWRGNRIYEPGDETGNQIGQVGKYLGKQLEPFALSNLQQMKQEGASTGKSLLPFIGITPAPKFVGKTAAQEQLSEEVGRMRPAGGRPILDADKAKQVQEALGAYKTGGPSKLRELLMAGKAPAKPVETAIERMAQPQEQNTAEGARKLPLLAQFNVYKRGNAQEKYRMIDDMAHKAQLVLDDPNGVHSDDEKELAGRVLDQVQKDIVDLRARGLIKSRKRQ